MVWMWIGACALSAGCAVTGTPVADASFGEAVRQARAMQTIDRSPRASRSSLTGLDGQAARSAIERYHESFRTPSRSFDASGIGGVLGVGSER